MKSTARLCLGLISFSSFLAFTACGDDDDAPVGGAGQSNEGGAHSSAGSGTTAGTVSHAGSEAVGGEAHGGGGHGEAAVICQVLGSLCHDADTGSGRGAECHELGHVGNAQACEEEFAGCIGFCVEGATGEGGAGGGTSADQDPYCAALGSLCHPIEDGIGPECHELGHEGNGAACAARFDECGHFCLEASEALPDGAGGAGGAAGQVGNGGAGGGQ